MLSQMKNLIKFEYNKHCYEEIRKILVKHKIKKILTVQIEYIRNEKMVTLQTE